MTIKLYMDVHIPRSITQGIRLRGVDVVTAQEDNTLRFSDPDLLDRDNELERCLFSFDKHLLMEAAQR